MAALVSCLACLIELVKSSMYVKVTQGYTMKYYWLPTGGEIDMVCQL